MSDTQLSPLRRRLSPVWVIPGAAVLIGIYMLYYQYTTQGPEIELVFDTAQGLEVGKTEV